MITFYYSLLIALAVPALVALIIFASAPEYRKYLFVAIPITLAILFKLIYTVDTIKAIPKDQLPADYFYISSVEIPEKVIYMWIVEKDKTIPHTVAVPWTPSNAKAVAEAKKGTAEGKIIAGKGKKKGGILMDDETGELLLYQFQLKDIYKK